MAGRLFCRRNFVNLYHFSPKTSGDICTMIEFTLNFQTITILLLSVMALSAILVFPVYLRRIRRVSRYAAAHASDFDGVEIAAPEPEGETDKVNLGFAIENEPSIEAAAAAGPASVVVYAQDEAECLARLLPQLLGQQYEPGFEVIVVNEGGSEATADVVSAMATRHKNLYLTYTPDGARSLSRKKLALMLGIKAAQHRVVVHTMATAQIDSPLWLAAIMRNFADGSTEVVLGNAMPENTDRGLGSRRRTFDWAADATNWLTSALGGHPYRGTEYNIAYTRDLFFRNKGFSRSLNMRYGDDDIFVSEIANGANTVVELSPESLVRISFRNHKGGCREMTMRHEFTGRYISKASRRLMALGGWLLWIMTGCGVAAGVLSFPNAIPAIAAFVVIVSMLWICSHTWSKEIQRLGGKKLALSLPWLIMMLPLRNLALKIRARLHKHKYYSWC